MSRRANMPRHGANHMCGGSDPIPGICDLYGRGTRTLAETILAHPCVVSFWPMDDTGPGAADALGVYDLVENPAGSSTGQPVSTQGGYSLSYGQAGPFADAAAVTSIEFDGDTSGFSSHGTILYNTSASIPTFGGDHTLAGWVYNNDGSLAAVFSTYEGTSNQNYLSSLSDDLYFGMNTDSVVATDAMLTSAWRYVVVTFDDTANLMELWINGVSMGTTSRSSPVGAQTIRFGAQGTGASGPTNFWRGRMCQMALFDCVLTDDEIAGLAALGGTGAAAAGQVLTADGTGGVTYAYPTISVDDPAGRYNQINLGTGLTGTDEGDGSITVDAAGGGGSPTGTAGGDLGGTYPNPDVAVVDNPVLGSGSPSSSTFLRGDRTWAAVTTDPATDTKVWMPLTTTVAGDDVLVYDAGHSLIPTLIPL